MTIIDCISDLHGFYPKLEGGDLLIVAGDLTRRDTLPEYLAFNTWLSKQDYRLKIVIAGNHDGLIESGVPVEVLKDVVHLVVPVLADKAVYLCDQQHVFEGLKIWGSPWTKTFKGMNPKCKAFTCNTDKELAEKWALIPDDIDILIAHGPSYGIHDTNVSGERCGSESLTHWIANHVYSLKIFICGHIHEANGIYDIRKLQDSIDDNYTPIHVNCSHVNERYEPVNKPIRIEL